jgi:ubiquinone/menaquinone biosynthesis C-methylase UbiE
MGSGRRLGFLKDLGEFRFKLWLDGNAEKALKEIGVGEGEKVLDFGCGSGTYTLPAARLVGGNGHVYALDVAQVALERIRRDSAVKGLDNISTILSEGGSDIPLDDGALDRVMLIDVIQEVQDRVGLLEEAFRVLKPEGVLVVFPMHITPGEVIADASRSGFKLDKRMVKERLLIFTKS